MSHGAPWGVVPSAGVKGLAPQSLGKQVYGRLRRTTHADPVHFSRRPGKSPTPRSTVTYWLMFLVKQLPVTFRSFDGSARVPPKRAKQPKRGAGNSLSERLGPKWSASMDPRTNGITIRGDLISVVWYRTLGGRNELNDVRLNLYARVNNRRPSPVFFVFVHRLPVIVQLVG